ncbi:MAG TPA: NADH:ubiquinone reductase (Na(+)-transporting) subunit C [Balneolaceae bacterium]|nr:NADH:ubiquinone reductase (Na(+)-transporting) subunit C [Balneolaceae bacterium]|tara:strand:+ start:20888 stop:21604 length:717 start_codon:yes stop_codon:yes gene_type:complete
MNVNSNAYTFGFAGILVILVAAALASAATILKPFQDKNVEQEKMQNILSSIGVDKTRDEAAEVFDEYVVDKLVLSGGEVVEGMDAFGVVMEKEARRPNDERNAPLYIAEKDGETYYVIPLRGTGLWGPIWGYIALESDVNTIYGAVFDHKGETPGLGAEITTPAFTEQFKGKKILEGGDLVSISVVKANADTPYEVDGISGGTITSNGVEAMIQDCLASYYPFLEEYAGTTASAQLNN